MDYYKENLKKLPELDDIGKLLSANAFSASAERFLSSIYDQSKKRLLSQNQMDTAKSIYNKHKNPPKRIVFDDHRKKRLVQLIDILSNVSPMSYEINTSFKQQLETKGYLSEKQMTSLRKRMLRFKRAIMKRIFGER
jgi:hypothetical protein